MARPQWKHRRRSSRTLLPRRQYTLLESYRQGGNLGSAMHTTAETRYYIIEKRVRKSGVVGAALPLERCRMHMDGFMDVCMQESMLTRQDEQRRCFGMQDVLINALFGSKRKFAITKPGPHRLSHRPSYGRGLSSGSLSYQSGRNPKNQACQPKSPP